MGILYLRTMGLAFVGVVIDLIAILAKSNLYYARRPGDTFCCNVGRIEL